MNTLKNLVLLIIIITSNNIYGQSNKASNVTKSIDVTTFNKLEINGAFHLTIQQGKKEKMTIETDTEMIDKIKVENKNNRLSIGIESKPFTTLEYEEIKLNITVVDLNYFSLDGFIELVTADTLKFKSLNLTANGATKGKLYLDIASLDCTTASFCELELSGYCKSLHLTKKDASSIDASQLTTDSVSVDSSGFGEVNLQVVSDLNVKSSGAVKMTYSGNPSIEDIDIKEFSTISKVD